ncbi:MAG TPA: YihY/virulence factor BrkB family protein [Thermoanaerobaculia bacterium]|nr:YihY/virulence factor BrkB family protein [Thermoanaerobaculia bacterium]
MRLRWKRGGKFFLEAFRKFGSDNAPQYAAAMAFFTILSLAPLLLMVVGIAGLVFGAEAARGEIVGRVAQFVGDEAALAIQQVIRDGSETRGGAFAGLVSFLILLWSASRIFRQLKVSLNAILDVAPRERGGIRKTITDRLVSLLMVVGAGIILLLAIAAQAIIGRIEDFVAIPGGAYLWRVAAALTFFLLITGVVALVFKYVPDVEVGWKAVLSVALFTALLLAVSQFLIGLYLGRTEVGSSFGAASSLILILVWIYFTMSVLFFGAECMELRGREDPRFVHDRERRQREQGHVPRKEDRRDQGRV